MAPRTSIAPYATALTPQNRRAVGGVGNLTGYINAGGRGTRLYSIFTPDARTGVTKALLQIGNPPITLIDHQINQLTAAHISVIVVGAGDHANVTDHIDRTFATSRHIHAFNHSTQLGTGGDLIRTFRHHTQLFGQHILIVSVDGLVDLDYAALFRSHINAAATLTIALTLNPDVPNPGAYYVNSRDEVIYSREVQDNPVSLDYAQKNCHYQASSTGAMIITAQLLSSLNWEPSDGPLCLYKNLVAHALKLGKVLAYNNGQRLFADIGTVNSWNSVHQHWQVWQPIVKSKSINQGRRPITVNRTS